MHAQTLKSQAGWQWVQAGFAIYRRAPFDFALLLGAYWFLIIALNLIPVLGTFLASLAMPGLSVGLLKAAQLAERNQSFGVRTLFESLRQNPKTLSLLGAIYLVCSLGAMGLSALMDGGAFFQLMLGKIQELPNPEETSDSLMAALLIVLLMTPVLMAYWFAPVLAAWHQMSAGKALFFSFVACWMNWRPFLTYGIGLMLWAVLLPSLLFGVLLLLLPVAQGVVSAVMAFAVLFVVVPAVYASFYASYRDIFGVSEIV